MEEAKEAVSRSMFGRTTGGLVLITMVALATSQRDDGSSSLEVANKGSAVRPTGGGRVSSWLVPHWWWLTSPLSLDQAAEEDLANKYRQNLDEMSTEADDSPTLSLVLPLEVPRGGAEATSGQMAKRGGARCGARCRRGGLGLVAASDVQKGWQTDYISMPESMLQFSRQAEHDCRDLSVQLFRVDLSQHFLEPLWVRDTAHLGVCPSKLQKRRLGENVWPSVLVEVKCLCQQESCSNTPGDFKCQAVRAPVRTWVRHQDRFMPAQEMVSVGCVCAQRNGLAGRYIPPMLS